MRTGADRAWERRGGWGALGVAVFGALRLAALVAMLSPRAPAGSGLALLLAAGVGVAAAQAFAVEGARRRLGAASRLTWTAAAAGWIGAALSLAQPVLIGLQAARAPGVAALQSGLLLGWLAAFATALWATGVAAADWRRERLPPVLRVVGTAFAVFSLAAAVLPPFAVVALPFALAWWIGLGVTLLRSPRSTSG